LTHPSFQSFRGRKGASNVTQTKGFTDSLDIYCCVAECSRSPHFVMEFTLSVFFLAPTFSVNWNTR
jgi:hypothetical protein